MITEENFALYAAKNYQNRRCLSTAEYEEDLARFKYLKRMIRKYISSGELQERVILNHIIVIHNMFGIEAGKEMCFFRMEKELWPILKAFLSYLNYLKEDEYTQIEADSAVAEALARL